MAGGFFTNFNNKDTVNEFFKLKAKFHEQLERVKMALIKIILMKTKFALINKYVNIGYENPS